MPDDNEYIVSGMTNIEKFLNTLEITEELEDDDTSTVNGWAMSVLGRIPEEGDSFEALGLTVRVIKMDGRRIEKLHVLDSREKDEDDEDEE